MKFADLTRIALLGVERQPLSLAPAASALGEVESRVDTRVPEQALLSLAALNALHEQIGALPASDSGPVIELPPAEQRPYAGTVANSLLSRLLGSEFPDLLPEWLKLAARAGQIAQPELVPALLCLGTAQPDLREDILPAIGERGRWLAGQNDDWSWVSGATETDESIWHTGERPARLMFLRRLRQTAPARAHELLAETWKQETPEDRAAFLGTFETALSPQDEPFLEAALDDKRKEVRRTASLLLARLPESQLVQRMISRAKPLLKFVPAEPGKVLKLKKGKPASIAVTLPDACDKALQRDGVEVKPPQGFGEKAWWLIQMIEAVPLEFWMQEWQTSAEAILAASQMGEWKKELVEAWIRAAIRQRSPMWAEHTFPLALETKRFETLQQLFVVMAPAQREHRLRGLLEKGGPGARECFGFLITKPDGNWSADFSRAVLTFMRRETARDSGDWTLRNQFASYASYLSPEALYEAATGWPVKSESWAFWSKGIDDFLAAAQFRASIHSAFSSKT